jgi:hypothetical protein
LRALCLSCGFVLLSLALPNPGGAGPASAPAAPDQAGSGVGRNVRLDSPDPGALQPEIEINPLDPRQVIAAAFLPGSPFNQLQFYSRDGGATWHQTSLPLIEDDTSHLTSSSVAWTSDGTAWANAAGVELKTDSTGNVISLRFRQRTYRSADGGATWLYDSTPSQDLHASPEGRIWVDAGADSPYRDSLYACWYDAGITYVNVRPDATRRWGTPIRVSGAETPGIAAHCGITTNEAGDAFVFWSSLQEGGLYVSKSSDGGATWSAARQITPTFAHESTHVPAFSYYGPDLLVTPAASRAAGRNVVLAAWTDLSGEAGCTGPEDEPGLNAASRCKTRIWLLRSTDGGDSWQRPIQVHDSARRNDQFNPHLAVDRSTGRIGLAYYDTTADPRRRGTDLWFQSSTDGGGRWSPPRRITTARTDLTQPAEGGASYLQYGFTIGLSAAEGRFLAAWTDRRERHFEHIWVAKIDPR